MKPESGQMEPVTPTHFMLTGQGIQMTYDTTSFDGQQRLYYHADEEDVTLNFKGDQIRVLESEIGKQVMVTFHAIPDGDILTLTLLVPDINLMNTNEQPFSTIAILTTRRGSIGGPALIKGAIQSYQVVSLDGNAQFVVF